MSNEITVFQMPSFKRVYKKLHANQKEAVNNAVEKIKNNPLIGEEKKGNLAGVFVYKFDCINQQFLLAYEWNSLTRTLIYLGVHENFYRDMKN